MKKFPLDKIENSHQISPNSVPYPEGARLRDRRSRKKQKRASDSPPQYTLVGISQNLLSFYRWVPLPPKLATVVNRLIQNLLNLWGPCMLWTPRIWFQKGKKMSTLHPITYPTCHPHRPFVAPSLLSFWVHPSVVHLKKLGQSCFENLVFLEKSWSGWLFPSQSCSPLLFVFRLLWFRTCACSCYCCFFILYCAFGPVGVFCLSENWEVGDDGFRNEFDYRCYWVWDECNIYYICLHKNNLWEAPQGGITAHVRDWIRDWSWAGTVQLSLCWVFFIFGW